ncbi:MAG: 50S ribosomal protein L32 [Staphylococcus epidermidis]|nr:50S ribosomal protein L32 [Staphylococcus epidermidis]
MAVPKRRTSKTRKNKRRTHFKISTNYLTAYVKTVVHTMVKK